MMHADTWQMQQSVINTKPTFAVYNNAVYIYQLTLNITNVLLLYLLKV